MRSLQQYTFVCLLLLPFGAAAFQKTTKVATPVSGNKNEVRVICKVYDFPTTSDSLTLYEITGLGAKVVRRSAYQPDSTFLFKLPAGAPRFYGIGINEMSVGRVILGEEPEVKFYAYAFNMDRGRTANSPANKAYEQLRKQLNAFTEKDATLTRASQSQSINNVPATVKADGAKTQALKVRFLDSLKTANPLFWKVASLRLQPHFVADSRGHGNPFAFYSAESLRYANFDDPTYETIPDVYDAFQQYALMLVQSSTGGTPVFNALNAQLSRIKPDAKTYRMALGGAIAGVKERDNETWAKLTLQYLTKYRNADQGEIATLDNDLKRASTFLSGMEAPDLAGLTPDSTLFALKAMRGKVVLVDFWASWCGPCRRENPAVKLLYEKYKDKGFDILGVSLDRDKPSWVRAIQADGLPWRHISDLRGWQSAHAQLYSVTSIPQTVLLDRQGKIIERNLRGVMLEDKLKTIFGE